MELSNEIESRFAYILNPSDAKFDPIYTLTTFIDPNLCFILPKNLLEEAKKALVRWVRFPLLISVDLICIF